MSTSRHLALKNGGELEKGDLRTEMGRMAPPMAVRLQSANRELLVYSPQRVMLMPDSIVQFKFVSCHQQRVSPALVLVLDTQDIMLPMASMRMAMVITMG